MKNKLAMVAALIGCMAASGPVLANAELAASKQCMQCHKMTEDFAAPSFKKIASMRKSQPDAMKVMISTIRRGSAATDGPHWGKAKMPDPTERPLVSEAEARILARWILEQ